MKGHMTKKESSSHPRQLLLLPQQFLGYPSRNIPCIHAIILYVLKCKSKFSLNHIRNIPMTIQSNLIFFTDCLLCHYKCMCVCVSVYFKTKLLLMNRSLIRGGWYIIIVLMYCVLSRKILNQSNTRNNPHITVMKLEITSLPISLAEKSL